MEQPFISVVIPTYNRQAFLLALLDSLAHQDYPPERFEVIVVDDGSQYNTRECLQTAQAAWGGRLQFFTQTNQGPARARNLGAAHSQGDILAFVDDDCLAASSWLTELVVGYTQPEVAGVGGEILPHRVEHWLERYYARRSAIQQPPQKDDVVEYLIGPNASYRRDFFEQVGGFNRRLTFAAGEEPDLCARLRASGYSLCYRPTAVVYHRYSRSLRVFLSTFYRYGLGTAFYERQHYGRIKPRHWLGAAAWLYWPRYWGRYFRQGLAWPEALRFAGLDGAREVMLFLGILKGCLFPPP